MDVSSARIKRLSADCLRHETPNYENMEGERHEMVTMKRLIIEMDVHCPQNVYAMKWLSVER